MEVGAGNDASETIVVSLVVRGVRSSRLVIVVFDLTDELCCSESLEPPAVDVGGAECEESLRLSRLVAEALDGLELLGLSWLVVGD